MDLFDRYLQGLRILLPRRERDDIIRELSEEIRSQAAEKKASLGRPLTPDEQAAILGPYGHPLLTAARYRPHHYLIGPVVFPYYWLLLQVIIGLVVLGHVIGAVVLLAGGASLGQISQAFTELVASLLKAVGWITVLAACGDWWLKRSQVLERWNPSVPFPPLAHAADAVNHALAAVPGRHRHRLHPSPQPSSQSNEGASLSGFLVAIVLSAWWLLGLKLPYLFFGPGAAEVSWGASIDRLYPVLVAAQFILLGEHFLRLTDSQQPRFLRLSRLAWMVTGWFFIYLVATSNHQWVLWHGAPEVAARANIITEIAGRGVSLIDFVNYSFSAAFIVAALGCVLHSLLPLLNWYTRRGRRAAHA